MMPANGPAWLDRHRRAYEYAALATMGLGLLAFVVGAARVITDPEANAANGGLVAAAGILVLGLGLALAHPIQFLTSVARHERAAQGHAKSRRWKHLQTLSAAAHLSTYAAIGLLAMALAGRVGVFHWTLHSDAVQRLVTLVALAVIASSSAAYYTALRTPVPRPFRPLRGTLVYFVGAGAVLVDALAALLLLRPSAFVGRLRLEASDASFLILAACVVFATCARMSRYLPSLRDLFSKQREYYLDRSVEARRRSILVSATTAFFVLLLLVVLVVGLQVGLAGLVAQVPRNWVLVSIVGFTCVSMVVALIISFSASRRDEGPALIQQQANEQVRRQKMLIWSSASASALLLLMAFTLWLGVRPSWLPIPFRFWIDFLSFGLLAAIAPYGFYYAYRKKRIRRLEERFPDFLRDLASSRKAGLTLEGAVTIAARGDYGELTPEIQRMAGQLSWNVSFHRALAEFGKRVDTPLINRAVAVIREASRTGGHVTDVLMAAASDARELKNLENERVSAMGLYTMIIYITFGVFLMVAAVLYATFIPQLLKASAASQTSSLAGGSGLTFSNLAKSDFRVFFFTASIVQGLGNGILAGVLGSGKAFAGLRHASVMVLIAWATFAVVL